MTLRAGGGYAAFAGKEVSRALGLMSLKEEDCCGELADLTPRQLEVLDEWVAKFRDKYHVVGKVSLKCHFEILAAFRGTKSQSCFRLRKCGSPTFNGKHPVVGQVMCF